MPAPFAATVIPAHNATLTLENAVFSVLAQTGWDHKIVIVDDASTDSTAETIARLAAAYPANIVPLRNARNLKAGPSRNAAIEFIVSRFGAGFPDPSDNHAYAAFLDADDACLPGRFDAQRKFLQQRPECRLCGGAMLLKSHSQWLGKLDFPQDPGECQARSLFETVTLPSTFFAPLSTLADPRMRFSDIPLGEDWEFFVQNDHWLHFSNAPEPVCSYFRHDANATGGIVDSLASEATRIRKNYLLKTLGIRPGEREMKIHITVSPCKFWRMEEQGFFWENAHSIEQEAHAWLARLERANRETGYFPSRSLEKTIEHIKADIRRAFLAGKPARTRFSL